jgi:hypothetical protein
VRFAVLPMVLGAAAAQGQTGPVFLALGLASFPLTGVWKYPPNQPILYPSQ